MARRSRQLAYQREPVELRDTAWSRGYLTAWEVARICVWKSAQGNVLGYLTQNTEDTICGTTKSVLDLLSGFRPPCKPSLDLVFWQATRSAVGIRRGSGLQLLQGMGVSMASAVLAILNPDAWPVIDRWAWTRVFSEPVPSAYTLDMYCSFVNRLAALVPSTDFKSIHELDQALYGDDPPLVDRVSWLTMKPTATPTS